MSSYYTIGHEFSNKNELKNYIQQTEINRGHGVGTGDTSRRRWQAICRRQVTENNNAKKLRLKPKQICKFFVTGTSTNAQGDKFSIYDFHEHTCDLETKSSSPESKNEKHVNRPDPKFCASLIAKEFEHEYTLSINSIQHVLNMKLNMKINAQHDNRKKRKYNYDFLKRVGDLVLKNNFGTPEDQFTKLVNLLEEMKKIDKDGVIQLKVFADYIDKELSQKIYKSDGTCYTKKWVVKEFVL